MTKQRRSLPARVVFSGRRPGRDPRVDRRVVAERFAHARPAHRRVRGRLRRTPRGGPRRRSEQRHSALEISLRVLGVEGREVIVPANTFFATAAAVVHAGGIPRFADVAPDTLALSAATVGRGHHRATAGVILVHIGGLVSP